MKSTLKQLECQQTTSATQSLLGNNLRLKEILVFVIDRRCGQIQPSGQLNPDDTKDGGVTEIVWSSSPEILIVSNLILWFRYYVVELSRDIDCL